MFVGGSAGYAGPGYPLELAAGLRTLEAPMSVMADSYKAGHFLMYPECKSMSAYGEFREPMAGMLTGGQQDNRFVVCALLFLAFSFARPLLLLHNYSQLRLVSLS